MAGKSTKSWNQIRGQKPVNEARVATYRRLMDAEARLDEVRRRRGVSDEAVADALEIGQPPDSSNENEADVYLAALARYVTALGGRLELHAVFPDETVRLGEAADPSSTAGID